MKTRQSFLKSLNGVKDTIMRNFSWVVKKDRENEKKNTHTHTINNLFFLNVMKSDIFIVKLSNCRGMEKNTAAFSINTFPHNEIF